MLPIFLGGPMGLIHPVWAAAGIRGALRRAKFFKSGPGPSWEPKKNQKIEILKIKIRSAQNVGKVWISRKKILPALFGAI